MSLHPNLHKGNLSPKEKALELAERSIGYVDSPTKKPWYTVPVKVRKRELMLMSIERLTKDQELSVEDRQWWKEVLGELKKLPK